MKLSFLLIYILKKQNIYMHKFIQIKNTKYKYKIILNRIKKFRVTSFDFTEQIT